jgi:hypothetical protein
MPDMGGELYAMGIWEMGLSHSAARRAFLDRDAALFDAWGAIGQRRRPCGGLVERVGHDDRCAAHAGVAASRVMMRGAPFVGRAVVHVGMIAFPHQRVERLMARKPDRHRDDHDAHE